jgi:hypothetical protein
LLIAAAAALALAASPSLAQQDESPTEDHGAHHPSQDQPESQEKPSGGMGGMMGQGQGGGMMGQGGMMGGRDTDGMMGCPRMGDMMGGMRGKKARGMMMHSRPMMEARLAFTKADLEITEVQMPQWDAYAEAVRMRHEKMAAMHEDKMKAKGGTALERMDTRIKSMETMLDGLKALKGPTEALYNALSDEQKKKADKLLGGRCGMM